MPIELAVSLVGLLGILLGGILTQQVKTNTRMKRLEHRDRLSWLYIRSLIDHAYRHGAVPLPEPPEGWLDEIDE